jgi:putative flippase GtrA
MSASLESLMPTVASTPRPALVSQFLSFAVIGVGAALVFIALSSGLVALGTGAPDWIVSALCYAAFVVPVYLLHRRFSFRSDAAHRVALPRYAAVQATALLLATLFSWLAYGVFSMPSLIASVLVVGLTSGVNFIVLRTWAFARAL